MFRLCCFYVYKRDYVFALVYMCQRHYSQSCGWIFMKCWEVGELGTRNTLFDFGLMWRKACAFLSFISNDMETKLTDEFELAWIVVCTPLLEAWSRLECLFRRLDFRIVGCRLYTAPLKSLAHTGTMQIRLLLLLPTYMLWAILAMPVIQKYQMNVYSWWGSWICWWWCARLENVKIRSIETADEFETARRRAKKCKQVFERVRKERFDRFMNCFEHVSNRIDDVYKVHCLYVLTYLYSGNII